MTMKKKYKGKFGSHKFKTKAFRYTLRYFEEVDKALAATHRALAKAKKHIKKRRK